MKMHKLIAAALISSGLLLADLTPDQRRMDFLQLASLFWKQYGPYEWKRDAVGFDLAKVQPWLDRVAAAQSDLDYLEICHEYANSTKDGHVFFRTPSAFRATMPLDTDVYDGKVMIEFVGFAPGRYPIRVGDEVISVDGQPVDEIVKSFYPFTGFGSNARAQRRWAADYLFFRPQSVLPKAINVPDESVVVVKHVDGTEDRVTLPWTKTGEPFRGYGGLPTLLNRKASAFMDGQDDVPLPEDVEPWQRHMMRMGYSAARASDSEYGLRGYGTLAPVWALPAGFTIRQGTRATDFFASGFYVSGGKRIGYIRVPTMSPSNLTQALQSFEQEIAFFEANTDGLVVDVMRNPGGIIVYGHELARRLIPGRFDGIGFELRATANRLASISSELESLKSLNAQVPGVVPDWYIQSYEAIVADIRQALSENRGRTGPLPLNMPSLDVPSSDIAYTKPLIVLIDEFSLSTADLFPALIQDAGRGTLVGWRTGGLGGTNGSFNATSYSEGTLGVTFGLMVRPKSVSSEFGTSRYIENVGVRPDIELDIMTQENLLTNSRGFVTSFTNILLDKIGR